ncbi:ATP-dependent Clp protease ATP-binding subunit, partial [Candidatus Azambacteria bacterium]|nr:ATP-dependent Clp protease ATP-binding subunit [Candidatus Azambacteria bacterium]
PFSVVLLDELEKAHPNINNLFLQVLDEGYLTDDYGEKTSFLNSIIIATSNAGSEFIREKIKEGIDEKELESNLIEFVLKNHIFSPEFINRFDAVVVFTPLTKEDLFKVARIELGELNKKLKEKQLEIQITDELLARLAELGFDPVFGARALKRTINEKIEDLITQGILENKYRSGEKIIINPMML